MGAVLYLFIACAFDILLKIAVALADSRPFGLLQIFVHHVEFFSLEIVVNRYLVILLYIGLAAFLK